MAAQQGNPQTLIAPHYRWVQEEFTRLMAKLERAMATPPRPMGQEIVDGTAALAIWEQSLHHTTRKLPSCVRSFSNTILARSRRPSRIHTQWALIPLEQEINLLIALHRQLWQQPFAQSFQEGQALLSRCIEKIAADLNDLFTFFITIVEACALGRQSAAPPYLWRKEISCRAEMGAYKGWLKNMDHPTSVAGGLAGLPRLMHRLFDRAEARYSFFCRV